MSRRYENRLLGQSHNRGLPRVAVGSLLAFFFHSLKWRALAYQYDLHPKSLIPEGMA